MKVNYKYPKNVKCKMFAEQIKQFFDQLTSYYLIHNYTVCKGISCAAKNIKDRFQIDHRMKPT